MVLKDKGLLEKSSPKMASSPLGADARLEQGAGIPQAGSIDFGSTAGSAALVANQRQSDQVDLRLFAPRMDRAGTRKDTAINKIGTSRANGWR
jgi:hypothetical protein